MRPPQAARAQAAGVARGRAQRVGQVRGAAREARRVRPPHRDSRPRAPDLVRRGQVTGASSAPPPRPREPRSPQTSAGSRRAGALLLGAIVVVIVVVVVLVSSGGGKGSTPPTTAASTPTTTTGSSSGTSSTSTTSATKPKLDSTIRLSSPEPSTNATGVAYVLSDGSRRAFYVTAQGLPPSSGFFYAVWLYNSPSNAEPLGRASSVSSNGRHAGRQPAAQQRRRLRQVDRHARDEHAPQQPGPTC